MKNVKYCLSAALLTASASCVFAADLNICNWSDYIAEDTVDNFIKETKIDANYVLFDSNAGQALQNNYTLFLLHLHK